MANESFANSLLIEVEGSQLPADVASLLTYAYVDDSRNLPDLFVLRFRDPSHTVLSKAGFRIGARVTLKVQTAEPSGPVTLLAGEVTGVELELDRSGTLTEVRGLDQAHRLFRGRRVAAYPAMTVSDVVRKVATRAGLRAGKIDSVQGVGGPVGTQISQDNVSDWEFLSRLADLVGAQVAVVDGALSFQLPEKPSAAPDPGAKAHSDPLVLEAGRNLVSLRASVTAAEQVPSVEVRGWDFERKQEVTATAKPSAAGSEVQADPVKLGNLFKSPPYVAADPSWRTQGTVKATAEAIAAQLGGACVELDGVAKGNPALRAGVAVALGGVGDEFKGKYTLTSTRHLFSEGSGYTTSFTVSGRQERSFYGLISAPSVSSPSTGHGLVPAIVSDIKDPLKLGRVKLTLPWLSKEFSSAWARVAMPGAGKDRGAVFLPEVGDEVLAGFSSSDPDTIYVVGGLFNGKDAPPALSSPAVDSGSGEVAVRALVSRKGHKLELSEQGGITLATGDGKLSLKLDLLSGKVSLTGSSGVTVDAGTGKLELKGAGVTVDGGSGAVEIKGQKVSAQGTAQAELKASGQVTITGGIVKIN
ncbi:VgrG-related protein [Longispora albida]|uniref:VgrG-related protein n=1 Tax=Longispora albida TaxID=203523 RepID=UPI00037CF98B|nr:VgrG-related protein [Longispora albida]